MRALTIRSLALLVALPLAACGPPMRWEHPRLAGADAQAEFSDCSRQAWAETQNRAWMNRWMSPSYVRGRDGRLYAVDPWRRPSFNDTWFEEQHLRDFCLRNKGFRLVPVE
ncbi:MAG: hypothetical protein ACKO1J_07655 [Tagaea sp.]